MSAQRRTAGRRDAPRRTAPAERPESGTPAAAPASVAAAAPGPSLARTRPVAERPPKPVVERPPKPIVERAANPAYERPPKPAVVHDRADEERGAVSQRFGGLKRTYQDTVAELKKVNWPDRETTINLTLVVIGISVVLGILLWGVDRLLQLLFEALP